MELWNTLSGMVEAELTCADIAASLAAIHRADITVFDLRQSGDLTACFAIRRKDYPRLTEILERRGESVRLLSKKGLYWKMMALLKRPVMLAGLAVFAMLALYLPTRVFFVRVEGNASVPTRQIISAAEDCGIRFGASRRDVRSERVKNSLLEAVPQLQWAGVNTAGCVATVSVRERAAEDEHVEPAGVSSIVALRDGVIVSFTATGGNALCRIGQAVKEGQTLISGYTDCGISIRAERAQGEVMARTSREIHSVMPLNYRTIEQTSLSGKKISLCIGKKRINLWKDSGISEGSCGRMYEEYYITLPGGFSLPVSLCVEEFYEYESAITELPSDAAGEKLADYSCRYLKEQMVAGTILSKQHTISASDGICRMSSDFICTEMIGRVQREQIGEIHGKNN